MESPLFSSVLSGWLCLAIAVVGSWVMNAVFPDYDDHTNKKFMAWCDPMAMINGCVTITIWSHQAITVMVAKWPTIL